MRRDVVVFLVLSLLLCSSAAAQNVDNPKAVKVGVWVPYGKYTPPEGLSLFAINSDGNWDSTFYLDPVERNKMIIYTPGNLNITVIEIKNEFNQKEILTAAPIGILSKGYHSMEKALNQPDFAGFALYILMGQDPITGEVGFTNPVMGITTGSVMVKPSKDI
jgi:hypothetical protein